MKKRICLCILVFMVCACQRVLAESTKETVEKFLDIFTPAMGGVISTGVLGPPGNLGGLPHFSLGLGASLYPVKYKDPFDQKDKTILFGFPSLQGRIGLFKGIKLGSLEGIGSIDLGAKYGYLPTGGIVKRQPTLTGFEARVGILKEGITIPSLSLSITSNSLSGLRLEDQDWQISLGVSTFGVKALVGKRLPFIHPYAGLGYENCNVKADYEIKPLNTPIIKDKWELKPLSLFRMLAGCEFGIPFVKLGIEYNRLGDSSVYFLGLRTGF